jgi:hypothetical protein
VTKSQATLVIRERASICLLLPVSGVVPKERFARRNVTDQLHPDARHL